MKEKITFILMLVLLAVTVSGCVKKTEAPSAADISSSGAKKDNVPPAAPSTQEESLPKATGKVDDLVNAASSEAEMEKSTLSDEESAASSASSDTEEINNLSNSYDENQL